MSARIDEVEETIYHAYVLTANSQLIQPRPYKKGEPSHEMLADQLVQFNYTKRDEFQLSTLVVVKTVTTIEYTYAPTAEELAAARKRIDISKAIVQAVVQKVRGES